MSDDEDVCALCQPGLKPRQRSWTCENALLARGWRPFPATHTLPPGLPSEVHHTRVAYDEEPRKRRRLNPVKQYWFPSWVNAVQKAYAHTRCGLVSDEMYSAAIESTVALTTEQWAEVDAKRERDAMLFEVACDLELRGAVEGAWRLGGAMAVYKLLHLRYEGGRNEGK